MNLTGQLLISMPSLQDERFYKTVIYLCAHSKDGAMGIIINKKIDYDLYPDLLEQLGIGFVENVARKYMQYEVIWITIFVMGMLGLLFDITIRKIIDKTIPWRGKG